MELCFIACFLLKSVAWLDYLQFVALTLVIITNHVICVIFLTIFEKIIYFIADYLFKIKCSVLESSSLGLC